MHVGGHCRHGVSVASDRAWQRAEKGKVNSLVMDYVSAVEQNQAAIFDRFVKLAYLYDPNSSANGLDASRNMFMDQMSENVIAANVDTVTATITASEVRPRMMTDDADWSVQRNAQAMSFYAEGLSKLLDIHEKSVRGFHSGALKGGGLNKVYRNAFDEIVVEPTLIDDIVVDEKEVRGGKPRQMHQRMLVDREVLKAEFPGNDEALDQAQTSNTLHDWSHWAGYRPLGSEEIVCLESWYLPIGRQGKPGYVAGRHTIVIDGHDLVDEEWHKSHFPFAMFSWVERESNFYPIGLAERIVGNQRELNKLNWTEGCVLEQNAVPTQWCEPADANIQVRSTGRLGRTAVFYGSRPPQTVTPNPLSPQLLQRRQEVKSASFEESGVSRMAASAAKPGGIDSAVGLREYRDQTTQRFSRQEKGFEKFVLNTVWLALECAKELGEDAPTVMRRAKYGPKKLKWQEVESDEIRVWLAAASTLGRTPAGRAQLTIEMAEGGVISQEMARRLLMPNSPLDVEREMSLYTAALEDVEASIEEILDGGSVVPEPYQNARMAVWRGQMAYLKANRGGAPEEVLETLRQWIEQSAWIVSQSELPPENVNAAPMGPAPAVAPPQPAGAAMPLPEQVSA